MWLYVCAEKGLVWHTKTSGFDELSLYSPMLWEAQFSFIKGLFGFMGNFVL